MPRSSVPLPTGMFPLFNKAARPRRTQKTAPLDLQISCAPVVVDDNSERGPGSYISGQLRLESQYSDVRLTDLYVTLDMVTIYKRPVHKSCTSCCKVQKALHRWNLLKEPLDPLLDTQNISFFELLPSHLPPSVSLSMMSIIYQLRATALVQRPEHGSYIGSSITADQIVPLCRVSSKPQLPPYVSHNFTSTGIEFRAFLEPIQINNVSNVSIQLEGLVRQSPSTQINYNWKIMRTEWMLDEVVKYPVQSCEKHPGLGWLRDAQKPLFKTRNLAGGMLYEGWNSSESDESAANLDLIIDLSTKNAGKLSPTCSYDNPNFDCLKVAHYLTLELSVILERYPSGGQDKATSVGVARIIKQRFPVSLVNSIIGDGPALSPCLHNDEDLPSYEMATGG